MPKPNATDLLSDLTQLHNDLEDLRRRMQIFCTAYPTLTSPTPRPLDITLPCIKTRPYPQFTKHHTFRS